MVLAEKELTMCENYKSLFIMVHDMQPDGRQTDVRADSGADEDIPTYPYLLLFVTFAFLSSVLKHFIRKLI